MGGELDFKSVGALGPKQRLERRQLGRIYYVNEDDGGATYGVRYKSTITYRHNHLISSDKNLQLHDSGSTFGI